MIKSIIFDFDGVIQDTFNLGFSVNKQLDPKISSDEYKKMFMGNLYENKEITKSVSTKFFEIAEAKYSALKIEGKIKKELMNLKNNYKLFIVTSNKESILKTYIENNKLDNVFEEVLGFESDKSKVKKFEMLFDKHNLNKEECVFITDTLGDILEANQIGIKTIAVDFGFHSKETLEKGKPYSIISDFLDIKEAVK